MLLVWRVPASGSASGGADGGGGGGEGLGLVNTFYVGKGFLESTLPAATLTSRGSTVFITDAVSGRQSRVSTSLEWRDLQPLVGYPLFQASQGTSYTWTPSTSYTAFGGTNKINLHRLDFIHYRQARITVRAKLSALLLGDIGVKIVDIDNVQDITPEVIFTSAGTWETITSAWQDLDSAAYTDVSGYITFEAQGISYDDISKIIVIGGIILELR